MLPKMVTLTGLKYAHEEGCPWNEALVSMLPNMVTSSEYAHENGCPWMDGLFLWLPEWSPRVFEIFARKRVALGIDLLFCCLWRSPQVFEIFAREQMSLGGGLVRAKYGFECLK